MDQGTRAHLNETIEKIAQRLSENDATTNAYERDFAGLLAMLIPRIAKLIRQYRLEDMREDAEQAAAIGVHRALLSFDREKARFATHVTWQIRGELQSLRHRMRLDQRTSAKNAGVMTVSLEALGNSGEERLVVEIADDAALPLAESGASDAMALSLMNSLLDRLESPAEERAILLEHLLDRDSANATVRTRERRRQIVRRTYRNCIKMIAD
ncbi:MAG: hypothetical protein AAF941_04660 [Pseudomonadota bacterium]